MPTPRKLIAEIAPNLIREVADAGFGMQGIIPLWFGEGDLPTAGYIKDAASQALADNHVYYLPNSGLPDLREAIRDYTNRTYGLVLDRERITVTASGMQGIMLVMQALIDPGDEVVTVTPAWPNLAGAARVMGGIVHEVNLTPRNGGWGLDVEKLFDACNEKTRAVCINSPSNPTGWMIDEGAGAALMEFCRKRGIWLICDDVYSRIVYERNRAPFLVANADEEDRVISINSFSKTWSMTGWRLGWIVAPAELERALAVLNEFNIAGPTSFVQHAGIAALREGEDDLSEMLAGFRRCRDIAVDRLSALPGITVGRPDGAFYAFFRVDGLTDSLALAKRIVREAGVGLAPGRAFGEGGEGYLRACFATRPETLEKAMDRLEAFFTAA
jgi:aspartate/methionine/tyrosine aminotransferase